MSQTQISLPTEITAENLQSLVMESDLPILLDFWASWCVPCNLIRRSIEKAAEALADEARIGLVNVDQQPEIVAHFGVRGTPTFVLVKRGQVVQTFTGMVTSGGLAQRVRHAIANSG
jgi:thioredoxin 1